MSSLERDINFFNMMDGQPEVVEGDNKENMETNETIDNQLGNYLTSLYQRLEGWQLDESQTEEFVGEAVQRANTIINLNNEISNYYKSDEYLNLKEEEKKQRNGCAIGIVQCIDGRISIPHFVDQSASVWETAAGILQLEESPLDGRPMLKSKRLHRAIAERAQNPEKDPLLEVLVAHTSLSDPEHGCGAMIAKRTSGEYSQDADLVLENLKIHNQRAEVITSIYNANVHPSKEKLQRAAITAVYDTDHMSLVLGYGTDNILNATDVAASLVEEISSNVEPSIPPGLYKENFKEVDTFSQQKKDIITINKFLLENDGFNNLVNAQIEANFPDLVSAQRGALRYLVARNVSFQYLSGLYENSEHTHHHPFAHHGEGYQAVALDGVTLGQQDPENQVFGAAPSSAEEAIAHIQTQCILSDKIGVAEKPYILFVSKTFAGDLQNGNRENEEGLLMETWTKVLRDAYIRDRVVKGELVVVPILINSSTRETISVPNFVGKK